MTNSWDNTIQHAKLRLDWAGCGIDRFKVLADTFLATEPHEVVTHMEREREHAHISYEIKVHHHPSPELSFAVGDVVLNLRATLDNLIWGGWADGRCG